jgi:DNA-binding CsgD family transcriptional regulator
MQGEFDVTHLLPQVRSPTLVLHRRELPRPDTAAACGLASRIPDARLVLLEGSSIAPYAGDTDAMLSAVDEFLGKGEAHPDGLSGREVEVLCLVAAGKHNREIAAELFISTNTVDRHVSNILTKTGAANRAEAAAYAARRGLAP